MGQYLSKEKNIFNEVLDHLTTCSLG